MAPRPKSNSLSTILIVVSISCLLLCGLGTFFAGKQFMGLLGNVGPTIGCALDMEAVRDAVVQYAAEKGTYPNAETWQDDVKEMVRAQIAAAAKKKELPFKVTRMNVDGQWGCMTSEQGQPQVWSTFVYNKTLAGKKPSEVPAPETTVLVFEAPGAGKNISYEYGSKSLGAAPKIMGNEREWLKANVVGEVSEDQKISIKSKPAQP